MVSYASPSARLRDIVLERRSTRAFRVDPIPEGVLRDLLRAAQWAPSPHNSQPWRFTVLRGAIRRRLGEAMAEQLTAELLEDGLTADAVQRQTERSRERIAGAPVVIVVSLVHDGLVRYADRRRDDLEWQMAVQSVGAVMQTLFLLASSAGLGSCWMAAPMYCPEVVRATLELPAHYHPQALALLGYPAAPGRVRERRRFEEIADFR